MSADGTKTTKTDFAGIAMLVFHAALLAATLFYSYFDKFCDAETHSASLSFVSWIFSLIRSYWCYEAAVVLAVDAAIYDMLRNRWSLKAAHRWLELMFVVLLIAVLCVMAYTAH